MSLGDSNDGDRCTNKRTGTANHPLLELEGVRGADDLKVGQVALAAWPVERQAHAG